MRSPKVKAILLTVAIMTVLATGSFAVFSVGWAPQFSRYRYISLEGVDSIKIESSATVELEHLVSGPTIPIEYSLKRSLYDVRIKIDPKSYRTNATIEIISTIGHRMKPQPMRGMLPNRSRPCGSYGNLSPNGEKFEFRWSICGSDADSDELVIAFDVILNDVVVTEEVLPFQLKYHGFYWLQDSL